jgi:hypothetical protein
MSWASITCRNPHPPSLPPSIPKMEEEEGEVVMVIVERKVDAADEAVEASLGIDSGTVAGFLFSPSNTFCSSRREL